MFFVIGVNIVVRRVFLGTSVSRSRTDRAVIIFSGTVIYIDIVGVSEDQPLLVSSFAL